MNPTLVLAVVPLAFLSGCSVLSVADAGVTVVANTVKLGANLVGAVSDVARAGVSVASAGVTVAADAVKVSSNVAGSVSDVTSSGVRVITNNGGRDR
jgi:hypothetical protein